MKANNKSYIFRSILWLTGLFCNYENKHGLKPNLYRLSRTVGLKWNCARTRKCGAHAYAYVSSRIRICEQTQTRESTQMRAARKKIARKRISPAYARYQSKGLAYLNSSNNMRFMFRHDIMIL